MQDKGNRRSGLRGIINKSSIYNTLLLLWGRVYPEHVKLNSTKQQPQSLDYDREYSPQRIEFTHTPPGTTINIKRSFQMLEDIGKQDLFRWKDEFLQTVKLAQWDEQTALQVLRSAIDAKYFYLLEGTTTLSDSFSAIFKFKYPEKNYLKCLNQLSNLKQDNFLTIKEYKDKIEELCIRISICMNWNEQQKTLKADETFFHGLSRRTQLEMARLNVRSIMEMHAIINTIEETLLEQLEGASGFSHHKESKDKKQDKQRKTLRFRYHGECRHSTEDYDYLNNKKAKQQLEIQSSDHGKNNYSIEDGNHQLKSLNIVSYIRGKPFRCILDTGSTFLYIGKEIVRELNLAEKKSEIIEANLINGQKIRTDKMKTQNLILENNQTHIYKADLNIIDSQEKVLILGIDFLIKNNVKIDFDEGVITVNNINLEIPNYNKKSSVESILEEKNTIFTSSTSIISPKVLSLVEENTGIENLGKIKEGEHEIKLEREEVRNKSPYRIPLTAKERVIEEIQKLLNYGIIRKSTSNYSSPSFPILKKNGNIGLAIDYRSLNKITQPDHYIFPKICDIFSKLHGMKVFSKIDLKSGYYQVPMKDSSIKYTAFSVENDRFEWLRMPFGLVNATKTFQRIIDKLFAGHENVVVYIDDVLVYSKNAEDHQDHLTRVLKLLNSNGVKMNLDNPEFFKEEIEFLGHKISGNGILPVTDKLEKITKIKPNKKKISSAS